MPIGKHRDKAAEDARTIARVTGLLEGYAATGANQVSIKHVLDFLDPRGLWSYDPERQKTAQEPLELPAGVDPMTGCRPASAPGDNGES
jgi:hypothetical protein